MRAPFSLDSLLTWVVGLSYPQFVPGTKKGGGSIRIVLVVQGELPHNPFLTTEAEEPP